MSNVVNSKTKSNAKGKGLIYLTLCSAFVFILLLLRDAYSVEVNKYIFIILVGICSVTMKTEKLIYLFCFLFPLYVGLPGNYLTLILIVRLLFDYKKSKISSLILTALVAVFMVFQNVIMGYVDIVSMMFIPGVIVVFLLMSHKNELKATPLIMSYSAGVAALGFIMLVSTLNVYEFTDLLSVAARLGSSQVNYVDEGIMNVSVDPNYYGLFTLSAVSTAIPIALKSNAKIYTKFALVAISLVSIVVALIGLSRAFVIVFVVWIVLYFLSQRNIKGTVIAVFVILATAVFVSVAMPEVVDALFSRFADADLPDGNGRLRIIQEFYVKWQESVFAVLFGVGLFTCNVHCMPLQFLFGGGLVLFVLMALLFFSYRNKAINKFSLKRYLPMLVTFAMMCSVPTAGLLNLMFPLIYVGLLMNIPRLQK